MIQPNLQNLKESKHSSLPTCHHSQYLTIISGLHYYNRFLTKSPLPILKLYSLFSYKSNHNYFGLKSFNDLLPNPMKKGDYKTVYMICPAFPCSSYNSHMVNLGNSKPFPTSWPLHLIVPEPGVFLQIHAWCISFPSALTQMLPSH